MRIILSKNYQKFVIFYLLWHFFLSLLVQAIKKVLNVIIINTEVKYLSKKGVNKSNHF